MFPIKESIFSKVAGLQFSTSLRINYFEGIFPEFWRHPQIMEQVVYKTCLKE